MKIGNNFLFSSEFYYVRSSFTVKVEIVFLLILKGQSPDAEVSSVKVSHRTVVVPVIFLSSIIAKTKGELCTTSRFGKNKRGLFYKTVELSLPVSQEIKTP